MRLIVIVVLVAAAGAAFIAWRAAAHFADRGRTASAPASARAIEPVTRASDSATGSREDTAAPGNAMSSAPASMRNTRDIEPKPSTSVAAPLPRGEVKWAPGPEERRARAAARFEAAREAFGRAPGDDARLSEAVAAATAAEAWSGLVGVLERAVEAAPENLDRRFELAAAQMRLSLWASAIEPLRVVVAGRPEDRRAAYNLASALTASGRLHEAVEAWDRVVGLGADADALARRAEVQMDLGQWSDAAVNLTAARELEPTSLDITLNLCTALDEAALPVEAETVLIRYVERAPRSVPVLMRLAQLLWRNYEFGLPPVDGIRDRVTYAALLCEQVLAVQPEELEARFLLKRIDHERRRRPEPPPTPAELERIKKRIAEIERRQAEEKP